MACLTRLAPASPLAPLLHEARADGALTVCDALHVAKPMFHDGPKWTGHLWK